LSIILTVIAMKGVSMPYKKTYKVSETLKKLQEAKEDGTLTFNIETLLDLLGYDPLDVNLYYVKNIKHSIRY
jgi:hypothetical protein